MRILSLKWFSFFLLLSILTITFFARLSSVPIRIWDEARNANNAVQQYLYGSWLVPYYEGSPDMWNTKPPLLIWLQAVSMHFFGINEAAVRLPAAIAAAATGLVLWAFCTMQVNKPWAGFLSGSVLAATFAYVDNHAGRTGDYDALMVLFMTAYSFCFFIYTQKGGQKWLYCFWIVVTLAAFTKGIAGLLLLPGIFLWVLMQKKMMPVLKEKAFYPGLLFFIVCVGGYYGIREQYNPGYLKAVYENELGGRYLSSLEGHQFPFFYYYENLVHWRYAYWCYFIVPAFLFGLLSSSITIKKITLFNACMVLPFLIIISSGGTKLDWYDLPVYPFLALQTGLLLSALWDKIKLFFNSLPSRIFAGGVLFVFVFFWPYRKVAGTILNFDKEWGAKEHRQVYYLHYSIRHKKDLNNFVFCYTGYSGQINFYIQKLTIEGVKTALHNNVEGLNAGNYAVVSEEELVTTLEKQYAVKKVEERFGCTVYLVLRRW